MSRCFSVIKDKIPRKPQSNSRHSQLFAQSDCPINSELCDYSYSYTSLEWIQNLPPIDDVISIDIPKPFFNSANEYTSLEWIQNLPPIDDVISIDIPKPFFHLLDNVNSMMERTANINTTTRTQILLNTFGDLDKKLFENMFLEKFPNSNLFTNISIHLQKYLFTCVNINNAFPRLQDVINIFSKTEVELSLVLRDINSQDDWPNNKKHTKEIDVNKKYNILFLDTEEIKFIVTQRMDQLSIIPT